MHAASPPVPACLYVGSVMHARLRAPLHRFRYRMLWLLVDIDRLPEAGRLSPLFSVARPNLVSFHPRDHGAADGSPLRPRIDRLLAQAGIELPGGRVMLLCCPRVLGHVFNPLSVYFAYRADGRLAATVYEVRNTFGERHDYIEPVDDAGADKGVVTQERRKTFHVSPFLPMDLRYRFRVSPPAESLRLRILACDERMPVLSTAMEAERRPLCAATILAALARSLLPLAGNLTGIHGEALRIFLKGATVFRHPSRARRDRGEAESSGLRPSSPAS